MSRFFGIILLSTCLLAPVAARADEPMRHEWNERENEPWHRYLKEKHIKDREWAKANKREQKRYWKWREQHRD